MQRTAHPLDIKLPKKATVSALSSDRSSIDEYLLAMSSGDSLSYQSAGFVTLFINAYSGNDKEIKSYLLKVEAKGGRKYMFECHGNKIVSSAETVLILSLPQPNHNGDLDEAMFHFQSWHQLGNS
jgi:hypothetical protein